MSKGDSMNKVREIAQRLADVEFSDFGTLGGTNIKPPEEEHWQARAVSLHLL